MSTRQRNILAVLIIVVLSCVTNLYAELITNGDFSSGLTNWYTWTATGATADFNVVSEELVVDNINAGGVSRNVSILNSNVSLVQGTTYTVSFDASSTVARPITVGPRRGGPSDYSTYFTTVVQIDTTMANYSFNYTHTEASDPGAQLIFFLGATDDPVYLDNVSMIELVEAYDPSPADGALDVDADADLTWSIPSSLPGAVSNVYFGTSPNPPLVSSGQVGTTYDPPAMDYLTDYYWRVDLVHDSTTYPGAEWTFTTAAEFGPADYDIVLGATEIVPDTSPAGVPIYPWFPDGHIAYLYDSTPGNYQMYWSGSSSYRTIGTSMTTMNDPGPAVLTGGRSGTYDNGGAWLMSVFRQSGNNMIGFFHAEDHEFPPHDNPDNIAWKSIGLCTSSDNGLSWIKVGQIITSPNPKPSTPTWGGSGDNCVVYDAANARWVCYYQEHWLYMAVSYDPDGAPGTWYKYYNGDFTEPGLGGQESPVPGLASVPGANPSVHYNTYLHQWVIVWHSWNTTNGSIWLSTSDDMVNWDAPIPILTKTVDEKFWYPTIIGTTDVEAGQQAWLCYAYWANQTGAPREFIRRTITFQTNGIPAAPTNLVATAGDGSVSLDWDDNTEPDLASYNVYRSTTSGSYGAALATGVSTSDYVDNTVVNGTTYYYVVTAVNTDSNESGYSNEDSATPQATPDTDPPTPNPATFAVAPAADSDTAISMTATTGSDASGPVEYLFTETSGNPGGTSSGWQMSPSYTDTGLDPDTQYTYTVTLRDALGNTGSASAPASATTDPAGSGGTDYANADIAVQGSVSGSYADTQASDNVYEAITEVRQGNPAKGFSSLEHKWTVNVTGGDTVTFYVEAYQTASGDGDNFVFAYSTDDSSYTNMLTVTKTSDDNSAQSYALPASTSGTVYISVVDTDSTAGNQNMDTVYVDGMYIVSTGGGTPDTDPPTPNPATFAVAPAADSDTAISMTATSGSDVSGPVEYYFTETSGNPGGTDSGWQTSPSYTDSGLSPSTQYTYTVTMRDSLGNAGTASTPASATTQGACVPTDCHVDAIVPDVQSCGGPNKNGLVTVTILDTCGNPVVGATVTGTFSGDFNETQNAVTDGSGVAVLITTGCVKKPAYGFCVDDVTGALPYDSNDNVETCDVY